MKRIRTRKSAASVCVLSLIYLLLGISSGFAQDQMLPLWPGEIPNSTSSVEKEKIEKNNITWVTKVQEPNISVYMPSGQNRTGQAVLICPGGGYSGLAYDWEGTDIAKWLNSKGIVGVVLKYRLPGSASVKESYKAPLQDAQRAMRLIRAHASEWGVDQEKVGVIGFSAGGHLASTLATAFDEKFTFEKDSIDNLNARPAFAALVYPVITMKNDFTHAGSRKQLLGENPSGELVEKFSNELQVSSATPPVFLVHATDDEVVPVENSLRMYEALKENNVLAEMHIYPSGGHGFSLALNKAYLQGWTERLYDWLKMQDDQIEHSRK